MATEKVKCPLCKEDHPENVEITNEEYGWYGCNNPKCPIVNFVDPYGFHIDKMSGLPRLTTNGD